MNDTAFCASVLADLFFPHLQDTEDLGRHLRYVEENMRQVTEKSLSINLERLDDHIKTQVPEKWKVLERPQRTLLTLAGKVVYKRRVYLDASGCRRTLLDEILGISCYQRIEPNAFLWIVTRAADVSFEKTRRTFFDKTGIDIARTTVMHCVHKCNELLKEQELRSRGTLSTEVLFCEFDGFWVHLQSSAKQPSMPRRTYKEQFKKKSKELKVWVAYAGKNKNKRISTLHWASDAKPQGFFTECLKRTGDAFDLRKIKYLVSASDGATWCKNHSLHTTLPGKAVSISKLDVYHVNQKVYSAFGSEIERSYYLKHLYTKDFTTFLDALKAQILSEPDDERIKKRKELFSYIKNNLDWLDGPTLAQSIREKLLSEIPCVFADRHFCDHLSELLSKRRYKRFLETLEKIVKTCREPLRYDYECFLEDAKKAINMIRANGSISQGTIEGTNAKVYAARLKVWGCSWSEHGAIAMMRIRACIASGKPLVAPGYNPWLTKKEKKRIEAACEFNFLVSESCGKGYEPPRATISPTIRLAPKLFGVLNFSKDPLPQFYDH
jgi:hypothetical protein